MNDKDLKKMNRQELLELILAQSRRIQDLEKKLSDAEQRAQSREIQIRNCGSIAEAALTLSGFFEAADRAAHMYIENVRQQFDGTENRKALMREE
ncbi:MAG: DNA repair protein [Clostridia bacterium]|nr:DNA repair protein [Clostridia bacterium]